MFLQQPQSASYNAAPSYAPAASVSQPMASPYGANATMQAQPQPQAQAFAHGGRIKRGKMVIAHMNPHELNILDHLQGKVEKCPRSGMRSYSHLEELLKNPHILASVHHHARQHHAMGGAASARGQHNYHNPQLNHMAHEGIHGDHELALIGPHTRNVFDKLATGGTINPHTGHPQYFSLGGALGGIWNAVKGVGSKIIPGIASAGRALLPSVMPHVQEMATKHLGEGAGSMVGSMGHGIADKGLSMLAGPEGSNPQAEAMGRSLGGGLGKSLEAYRSGRNLQESLGEGMQHASEGFGDSPMGESMRGMGEGLSQGRGFGQSMLQGGRRGFERAGGVRGLAEMGQQAFNSHREGRPMSETLQNMGRQAYSRMMPQQRRQPEPNYEDQGGYEAPQRHNRQSYQPSFEDQGGYEAPQRQSRQSYQPRFEEQRRQENFDEMPFANGDYE